MPPAVVAIADFLTQEGTAVWVALLAAALAHAFILMVFFGVMPIIAIWLERKISGRIQDRLGPTRVGGKFGWLQGVADGLKAIQKEDILPEAADKTLFRLAPYLANLSIFTAMALLPFSRNWVAVTAEISLFILLAILSLEVVGIVLAGYASGSKWSLFGGMREAAQMVSYEIPLALCLLIPVIATGSLNLTLIGEAQQGWFFPNWLIFHSPFAFVAFFIYFTVATAGAKRAPFDLAEAESELVGGFHTEYSTMRWIYFMLAEYAYMFVIGALAATLFLGGWWTGLPFIDQLTITLRPASEGAGFSLAGYLAGAFGALVLTIKAVLLVIVQIWARWTLPRLRIDQVMATCLKYLIPISCVLFLGGALWPLAMSTTMGRSTLFNWPDAWSRPPAVRFATAIAKTPQVSREVTKPRRSQFVNNRSMEGIRSADSSTSISNRKKKSSSRPSRLRARPLIRATPLLTFEEELP